jgi:hypothetical protein
LTVELSIKGRSIASIFQERSKTALPSQYFYGRAMRCFATAWYAGKEVGSLNGLEGIGNDAYRAITISALGSM